MRRVTRKVPRFESEDKERRFWAHADSTDYIDWSKARRARFPALRPSVKVISIRLPAWMLEELKALANARDVPYQSLLKTFLADRIGRERAAARRAHHRTRSRDH